MTLPAIAAPPWKVPAGSIRWDVTCEGLPLKRVEAAVETADGPRWEKILPGQDVAPAALPVAVRQASVSAPERKLPVEFVPPAEAGGVAYLKVDFPATIRVRLSKLGSQEVAFEARCTYSNADAIDGVALLWCPQDELSVSGYAQEWSARRRVSVTGDGVMDLELTAEADADTLVREVEFTVPEDGSRRRASMTTDAPPPWTLYRMTEHGLSKEDELEPEEDAVIVTRRLEAGTYVAIANYGQTRARHKFEVDTSTKEKLQIQLPELKEYATGDVKFVFSRSTHGEDMGYYVNFRSYLADRDAKPQTSGWRHHEHRRVPDGLVLCGLTEGDVHVLQLEVYGEDETVVALSRPVLVTVQREVQVVHVAWQPVIPLHEEWWYVGAYYRSEWPGYRLHLGSFAPGGPLTLEFVDDLKTLHTATVEFPHTAVAGGFRLPAELRKKLIELEVLEPDDD